LATCVNYPATKEKVMKEKKVLSVEEIASQSLRELPDRRLMQATNTSTINAAIQAILIALGF
jgi:hypothetical protein